MEMTTEEIVRSYRQAKNPRAQITVLAELNACSTAKIVETLIEGGVDPETLPKISPIKAPQTEPKKTGRPGRPKKEKPAKKPKVKLEDADTLEQKIEEKLVTRVKAHGGLCLKWVCPGWAGVPDRIVLLPGARVAFVETKRPKGGKLSKMQLWWGNKLNDLGFQIWVIWNTDDLTFFEKKVLKGE